MLHFYASISCARSEDHFSLPQWRASSSLVFESPADIKSWSVGAYWGQYNRGRLMHFAVAPWRVHGGWQDGYLVAGNAVYTMAHLPYVPVDLEWDFTVAAHYGSGQFYELGALPMFRWTWFPWNNLIDTSLRIGPFGASYTTEISKLEAADTKGLHTSRYLNLYMLEWTFAPPERSGWEAFVRIHHRSGIFGLVNDVSGGSNYVSTGLRFGF
ncbi:MAG: hypothetical protein AB7O57_24435 [Hyphomicrobiaceae bacterium]